MKNKIELISLIIIGILILGATTVYGKATAHAHVSHSTSHASSHSTSKSSSTKSSSSAKTTIKGGKSYTGKTYTAPKSFSSKYNSSNIKTGTVNSNPSHFTSYSTTNMFRPNFWTAMWAFNCMHNNTKEVTEQDISKELEERGYSQEEIKEILKEGEAAKEAEKTEQNEQNKGILIVFIIIVTFAIIVLRFIIVSIQIKDKLGGYMNNIEILKAIQKQKPFIVWVDDKPYNKREAIENLIQENKELKEKLQQYKKIEEIDNTITDDEIRNAIKNVEKDYIPKSKVKELLEHYKDTGYYELEEVLKELLEEGE